MLGRATNCEECRRCHKICKVKGVAVTKMESRPRAQGRKRKRAEADSESAGEPREPRPTRKRGRRVVMSELEAESNGSVASAGRVPYVLVPPRRMTRPEAKVLIWGKMEEQWKRMERMERRVVELERDQEQLKERLDKLEAGWNELKKEEKYS